MAKDTELAVLLKLHDQFSKQFQRVVKTTDKGAKRMARSFGGFGAALRGTIARLASFKTAIVAALAATGIKLIADTGAKVAGLTKGFENLTRSVGIDSAAAMVALKKATRDAVTEMELMRLTNQGILLGVASSTDQFAELASGARRLAGAMGIDVVQGFESIIVGIGRQSKLWLDNLGILVNVESAYEAAGKRLGKTTDELTDQERKLAFNVAALEAMRTKLKSLGKDTETATEEWQRFNATIKNFYEQLSKNLLPAIAAIADMLVEILRTPEAKKALQLIGDFSEAIRDLVKTGQELQKAEAAGGFSLFFDTLFKGIEQSRAAMKAAKPEAEDWIKTIQRLVDAEYLRLEQLEFMRQASQLRPMTREEADWRQPEKGPLEKMWKGAAMAVKDYGDAVLDVTDASAVAVRESLEATQRTISDVFFDALTGKMKSFKEYMLQFLTDLASALSDFAAKMAMLGLLELIPRAVGAIGGALGAAGKHDLAAAPGVGSGWQPAGMGGLVPLYQHGGITPARTPAIFGEGPTPEAAVPLPHGRSIPVEFTGGGGAGITINPQINFNMYAHDTEGFPRLIQKHRREFEGVVLDAMRKSVHFVREIRGK